MLVTIITHAIAFLAGGGAVFVYLHKHTTAAVTAATNLATDVASVKAAVTELKKA